MHKGTRVEWEDSQGHTLHGTYLGAEEWTTDRYTWGVNPGTYVLAIISVDELNGVETREFVSRMRVSYPRFIGTSGTLGDLGIE